MPIFLCFMERSSEAVEATFVQRLIVEDVGDIPRRAAAISEFLRRSPLGSSLKQLCWKRTGVHMNAAAKLRAIEHAEDHGDYSDVAKFIRLHGKSIEISEDSGVKEDFRALLQRIEPALEYERVHGSGSLLKLDKRENKHLIANGLISSQEVEAALRHQERQSGVNPNQ